MWAMGAVVTAPLWVTCGIWVSQVFYNYPYLRKFYNYPYPNGLEYIVLILFVIFCVDFGASVSCS